MPREKLLTFEDLCPPEIPTRTRLHDLHPLGIGTPHVESLGGYISRLALSYCVTPGILFSREISYVLEKGAPKQGNENVYLGGKSCARSMNSLSQRSTEWVSALEKLTGRNDLRHLTLAILADVITPLRLTRDVRCWCPECYQAAADNEQEPYEQLLWSVREVVACPIHRKPLLTSCPHCGNEHLPLAWRSRPGFCAKCHAWLGEIRSCPDANAWDLWRSEVVGELFCAVPQFAQPPTLAQLSAALKALARARSIRGLKPFARYLEFNLDSVNKWMLGRHKLFFGSLLMVCAKLGVTPLQFFTWSANQLAICPENKIVEFAPHRHVAMRTGAELKRSLINALKAGSPFDSLKKICNRLGLASSYVAKLFPDLVEQHQKRRKQCIYERRCREFEEFSADVSRVIAALRRDSIPITIGRVSRRLPRSGRLRSPKFLAIFTQIINRERARVPEDTGYVKEHNDVS